jgi:hypothetical protein
MAPVIGQGTTFSWKSATVGKVVSYNGPTTEREQKECTNCDSAGKREYIAGLEDGGTVHIECYLDETVDAGVWAVINDDGTSGAWAITYASGYGWSGTGFIKSSTPSGGADELEKIAFDLKVSGDPSPTSPT